MSGWGEPGYEQAVARLAFEDDDRRRVMRVLPRIAERMALEALVRPLEDWEIADRIRVSTVMMRLYEIDEALREAGV